MNFLKKKTKHSLINIGNGQEKTILEYCRFISKKIGANLKVKFDKQKPNGTPRKKLNSNLAFKYGWKARFDLDKGFNLTYRDFLEKIKSR